MCEAQRPKQGVQYEKKLCQKGSDRSYFFLNTTGDQFLVKDFPVQVFGRE